MKKTIWLVGLLAIITRAALATDVVVPISNCWPSYHATKPLNEYSSPTGAKFVSVDLDNPQHNSGNASYTVCNLHVPKGYTSGNPSVVLDWLTDSTDTTGYYCPAFTAIKVKPANANVSDNSNGSVTTAYRGTKQQSAGQYKKMRQTVSGIHAIDLSTGSDCASGNCADQDASMYIFWQDCTDPLFDSSTNIGGVDAANVKLRGFIAEFP